MAPGSGAIDNPRSLTHLLRAACATPAGVEFRAQPLMRTQNRTPSRRRTVLLVEDHQDTRELYSDVLNFAGFQVVTTGNAREGFDLALRVRPAVIVTDFWLPDSPSGADLCNRLKQDARTRRIPTLLVTASSQRKDVEAALSAGCAVVRLKPYLPDALERDVRALIARKRINHWPVEHGDDELRP